MLHQIYGCPPKKNPISAELKHTFCEVEFRRKRKSAEILGQNIESAEVQNQKMSSSQT